MKRLILALAVVAVMLASGVVAAATMLSASPSPSRTGEKIQARQPAEKGLNTSNGAGIHGGVIQRIHEAGGCSLIDLSTLQGNWTHGDYVAAVAALGSASLIPTAAQSDCGKPMVSVGHHRGPPDFVQQKLKAHQQGRSLKGSPGS